MANYYTDPVAKGEVTSLADFVLLCASRGDNLEDLRDCVEPWHDRRIERAREELEKVESMTPEQIKAACEESNKLSRAHFDSCNRRNREQKPRLERMLKKVKSWEVPDVISDLKQRMIAHLEHSLDALDIEEHTHKPMSADDWYAEELSFCRRMLEDSLDAKEKRQAVVEARNASLDALINSLRDTD